ncbi:hypothetical protein K7X08_023119 [Anisodus acutangulus]|uniref:Uncharacterized protein n=1 Tax=Anisodus acutangulus TaxID=402998 RepID=A0A9Q1MBX1_9SOLA|nr:hypothetical protein K7X08_023119 [Anisodus acutangulus]
MCLSSRLSSHARRRPPVPSGRVTGCGLWGLSDIIFLDLKLLNIYSLVPRVSEKLILGVTEGRNFLPTVWTVFGALTINYLAVNYSINSPPSMTLISPPSRP